MRLITLTFDPHFPSSEYLCFCRAVKRQDMEKDFLKMVNEKCARYGLPAIEDEDVRYNVLNLSRQYGHSFAGRREALIWAYAKTILTGVWVNV
jgi:hypothetical protein